MEGDDLKLELKIAEHRLTGGHDVHAKRGGLEAWAGWKWGEYIEERGDL